MSTKLGDDDRRAVDLLLDRDRSSSGNGNGTSVFAETDQGVFGQRLESVAVLLQLLQHLPAAEPPVDLVSRTMRRIEEAAVVETPSVAPRAVATAPTSRPLA